MGWLTLDDLRMIENGLMAATRTARRGWTSSALFTAVSPVPRTVPGNHQYLIVFMMSQALHWVPSIALMKTTNQHHHSLTLTGHLTEQDFKELP